MVGKTKGDWQSAILVTAIVAFLLALLCSGFMLVRYMLKPTTKVQEKDLVTISKELTLVNFKGNYEEIVDSLQEPVTQEAKALLKEKTALEYKKRNVYGEIKPTEVVFYDAKAVLGEEVAYVLVTYKELNLFNVAMTSYFTFKLKGGEVIEISTADYSNSSEFRFE